MQESLQKLFTIVMRAERELQKAKSRLELRHTITNMSDKHIKLMEQYFKSK